MKIEPSKMPAFAVNVSPSRMRWFGSNTSVLNAPPKAPPLNTTSNGTGPSVPRVERMRPPFTTRRLCALLPCTVLTKRLDRSMKVSCGPAIEPASTTPLSMTISIGRSVTSTSCAISSTRQ